MMVFLCACVELISLIYHGTCNALELFPLPCKVVIFVVGCVNAAGLTYKNANGSSSSLLTVLLLTNGLLLV